MPVMWNRSLLFLILIVVAQAQGGEINSVNDIYGACMGSRGTCLRPETAQQCIALRNCEYMVYILVENGMAQIALATYAPSQYVAVGFNAISSKMAPAVTVECTNDGKSVNAYLGNNPGHYHERDAVNNPAFQVHSAVVDNFYFLCQVYINGSVVSGGYTLDLANAAYYSLIALGPLDDDGQLIPHTKKYASDKLAYFN